MSNPNMQLTDSANDVDLGRDETAEFVSKWANEGEPECRRGEVVAALGDFVANCPVSLESVEAAVPELGHIFEDGSGNLVISDGKPVSSQPEKYCIEFPDGTFQFLNIRPPYPYTDDLAYMEPLRKENGDE